MALTLTESAKLSQDTLQRGVIETFARSSAILELMPWMDIQGNSYAYNTESELPGIAFRGVNEGYEESTGVVNQANERLYIAGGDSDVDRFITQTRSNINNVRAIHDTMKVKSMAQKITHQIFNGDSALDPNGFDGLKKRIQGAQNILAGENGAQLTQDMLDELIDSVEGNPDALFVSKAMRRQMNALLRTSPHYSDSADNFGNPVKTYYGVPVRTIGEGDEILGFNEVAGDSENTGSIYALKFGPEQYVSGLQRGGISVRDLGELNEKPAFRTRVEWYAGMAIFNAKAAARLSGILKAQ